MLDMRLRLYRVGAPAPRPNNLAFPAIVLIGVVLIAMAVALAGPR
jgi:hypothetical protein